MIRQLRLEEGWDATELAALAGCTVRTIQRVENGEPCYIRTIKGIADALRREAKELFDLQPINVGIKLVKDCDKIDRDQLDKLILDLSWAIAQYIEQKGLTRGSIMINVAMNEHAIAALIKMFYDQEQNREYPLRAIDEIKFPDDLMIPRKWRGVTYKRIASGKIQKIKPVRYKKREG